ncbi:class I SAM-dependent methyltransferase [Alteraurantiacibacter aestuarii]|uniref:class I SAM-dependent methyltransferase n=1 Tax=Alteraurantiacibacter aestuarii TaxID=650004 RepID=UPI0031D67A42
MSNEPPPYDVIGVNYADLRKPDPRIAVQIDAALGCAKTVLNVGAGTGSYEPAARQVTAIEPSAAMIAQRAPGSAPAIQGQAEALPFADNSFDASSAILTIHHWTDQAKGLAEMRRVTRGRIVLLTFDPMHKGSWLGDYLPQLRTLDEAQMPRMEDYARWLGPVEIASLEVPWDCSDGFLYAFWRRPEAYLDPRIRSGSSSFWKLGDTQEGLVRLAEDLRSGLWHERHSDLLARESCDVGYRLVIADSFGTCAPLNRSSSHERTAGMDCRLWHDDGGGAHCR